jgi:secondary thiamine-phosphate synthase enzyme
LSKLTTVAPDMLATATLAIEADGPGFVEITDEAVGFLASAGGKDGALLLFVRHTSASLVVQENADPDVLTDLATALDRLAPAQGGWIHDSEGPDDMPAHIKGMVTGVSLHVPVADGSLRLGQWQGIYLAEHRHGRRRREVVLQFLGSRHRVEP